MKNALPLLLAGGAALLLLGGKKKKPKTEKVIEEGVFQNGAKWRAIHIFDLGRFIVEVDFGTGEWVALSSSGMAMAFPSENEARKAVQKIQDGELVVDATGEVAPA